MHFYGTRFRFWWGDEIGGWRNLDSELLGLVENVRNDFLCLSGQRIKGLICRCFDKMVLVSSITVGKLYGIVIGIIFYRLDASGSTAE